MGDVDEREGLVAERKVPSKPDGGRSTPPRLVHKLAHAADRRRTQLEQRDGELRAADAARLAREHVGEATNGELVARLLHENSELASTIADLEAALAAAEGRSLVDSPPAAPHAHEACAPPRLSGYGAWRARNDARLLELRSGARSWARADPHHAVTHGVSPLERFERRRPGRGHAERGGAPGGAAGPAGAAASAPLCAPSSSEPDSLEPADDLCGSPRASLPRAGSRRAASSLPACGTSASGAFAEALREVRDRVGASVGLHGLEEAAALLLRGSAPRAVASACSDGEDELHADDGAPADDGPLARDCTDGAGGAAAARAGDEASAALADDASGSDLDVSAVSVPTFESYDFVQVRSRLRYEADAADGHRAAADREELVEVIFNGFLGPLLVGALCGVAAYVTNSGSNWLVELKWEWTFALLHGGLWGLVAFPLFAALCISFTAAAAALAILAPAACGSGIQHVKATLNGIRVPGALSLRTLGVKLIGITLVVASGLPAGREGPMVQIGACVSAAVLGLYRTALGMRCAHTTPSAQARLLDEDVHLRDYVTIGAAAGVAAAFNAPIGGVLFALEEVSTVWSSRLTLRCFFASIVGAVCSSYFVSGGQHGVIEDDALVVFGDYDLGSTLELRELPVLLLIGACGGLLGAAFNALNGRLNAWRQRAHSARGALLLLAGGSRERAKVGEAAAIALLCATLAFVLPLLFGCSDASTLAGDAAGAGAGASPSARLGGRAIDVHSLLVSVQCSAEDGEYNEIASITLSNQHRVVRALFSRHASGALFSPRTLLLCLLLNLATMAVVHGAAIPVGLFIPCMTIGALGGRLVGELIANADSVHAAAAAAAEAFARATNATGADGAATPTAAAAEAAAAAATAALATADTGFYALIGAAAMVGGVTRMTISLTVIMCEFSNDAGALLPLMATVLVAKVVGDIFTPSVTDIGIALAGFPFVEAHPPRRTAALCAEDVMTRSVVALPLVATARDVHAALAYTEHGAFPVIDTGRSRKCRHLAGLVHRYQLHALLERKAFFTDDMAARIWPPSRPSDTAPPSSPPSAGAGANARALPASGRPAAADAAGAAVAEANVPHAAPPREAEAGAGAEAGTLDHGGGGAACTPAARAPSGSASCALHPVPLPLPPPPPPGAAPAPLARHSSPLIDLPPSPSAPQPPSPPPAASAAVAARSPATPPPRAPPRLPLSDLTLSDLLRARAQMRRPVSGTAGGGHDAGGGVGKLGAMLDRLYGAPPLPPVGSVTQPPPPSLAPLELEMLVDLRPVMELSPLAVLHTCPLDRLHTLFWSVGLRHLFVCDTRNSLMGVITRKDLLPDVLRDAAEMVPSAEAAHACSRARLDGGGGVGDGERWLPPHVRRRNRDTSIG